MVFYLKFSLLFIYADFSRAISNTIEDLVYYEKGGCCKKGFLDNPA